LLRIAYKASSHDDNVTMALVNQFAARRFEKPDDAYDNELMNMDIESAEAALLKAGYRPLVVEMKNKTGIDIGDEELLNSKYHH
jgi:hypothetical protein